MVRRKCRTWRPSSQAATCPPVYHKRWRLHTLTFFFAEPQAGKLGIPIFFVFGLARPRIEVKCTVSEADALSTRPLNEMYEYWLQKEDVIDLRLDSDDVVVLADAVMREMEGKHAAERNALIKVNK